MQAAFEAQLQAAEGEVSMAEYQQQAAQRSAPPTGGGLAAVRGAAASRGSGSGGPKRRTMISEDMARGKQERALARGTPCPCLHIKYYIIRTLLHVT